MQAIVEELLASEKDDDSHYLAHSPWLEDAERGDIEALYGEYRGRHVSALEGLVSVLGPPDKDLSRDRVWFDTWFPEALYAVAWCRRGRWLCLAVSHADRETPVCLELRCVTDSRLTQLAG